MDLFQELKLYWKERENILFKEFSSLGDGSQKTVLTTFYYNAKFQSMLLAERESFLNWSDLSFYKIRVKTIESNFTK